MQVEDLLKNAAHRDRDKTALVCGEERFSYAQLERNSCALARALIANGVQRGDRVVVYLDNGPQ